MISAPYPDRRQRGSFLNQLRTADKTSASLALERLGAGRPLRLAQPEEPVAVPARAGHRFGDLRQAAEVLAVPGKTFFQDHDALKLASPFAHQQRSWPQGDAIAGVSIAPIEGSCVLTTIPLRLVFQKSPHRP